MNIISHNRQIKGFTLLEILVALLIVSVSLGITIRITGDVLLGTDNLRDTIIAQWVAENKANEVRLRLQPISSGTLRGSTIMGTRRWHWLINISNTPDSYVRKIEVIVSRTNQHKFPIASLISFTMAY